MPRISRAVLLGASSAIALVGLPALRELAVAAESAGESDLKILDSAIALERAGIKAYQDAAATNLLAPAVLATATGFMNDHIAHRDALIAAVKHAGGTPGTDVAAITYPQFATQSDVLTFALGIERSAATTYLAAIGALKDRQLARTMGSILGVETTHVALLASALGKLPAYDGFVS